MIWVEDGYLSAMEFPWYSDEAPLPFRVRRLFVSMRHEAPRLSAILRSRVSRPSCQRH